MKNWMKTLISSMRLTWGIDPKYFLVTNFFNVLQGISIALCTVVMAAFLNAVQASYAINEVALLAFAVCGMQIIRMVTNGIFNFMAGAFFQMAEGKTLSLMHHKIARLSGEVFENTQVLECIDKVERGSENTHNFTFTLFMIFSLYIPYFLTMSMYFASVDQRLLMAILLVFFPVILSQLGKARLMKEKSEAQTTSHQRMQAMDNAYFDSSASQTVRMYGAAGLLKAQSQSALDQFHAIQIKAEQRAMCQELLFKLLTLAGYVGIFLLLLRGLVNGNVNIGAFSAIFSSIDQLFGMMEELICRHMGNVTRSFGMISFLHEFLALPEKKQSAETALSGLKLENVAFHYPCAERNVLENVNLNIREGECVAIVGENGAGKSTLLKMIAGIYSPTQGRIQNGLHRQSAVFQNYMRYKMTLDQNVRIADMDSTRSTAQALEGANLSVNQTQHFPDGIDTMLSRDFGGVDLSGGWWQRVAIARALFRPHDILFLDEPTASLDALEENALYYQFEQMVQGKTAVIVTHRLGLTKLADRIIVLKAGRIVQEGTHDALISVDGEYKRMWATQAVS